MLTVQDVKELIYMTIQDAPPSLKRAFYEAARMDCTEAINRRIKMLSTQKTLCVIRHDDNKLPILEYLDSRNFMALSLSGGVILWVYRGMSMLIPAARIANMAATMEAVDKLNSNKTCKPKFIFTIDDVVMLPREIANALLDDDR